MLSQNKADFSKVHIVNGKNATKTITTPRGKDYGAGDAFLGGVVYGLSRNWELGRCVELGNYTGGKATTGIGCLTARASLQEFDELCRNR